MNKVLHIFQTGLTSYGGDWVNVRRRHYGIIEFNKNLLGVRELYPIPRYSGEEYRKESRDRGYNKNYIKPENYIIIHME